MTCSTCGQNPCGCPPAVLSGVQLVNSLLSNPTIDGMTANGGTATNLALVGAQLDCTSRGCTAGVGVCNDGIATNAQVCAAVAAAISSGNPAFCAAVAACITADPSTLCAGVATCIATTPGIINSNGAFGVNARATTALYGVTRFATLAELENANCLLAIDPCTLTAFWNAPNLASAMWAAFSNAVGAALGSSPSFCTAVLACGAAPLANPIFTGDPQAPTPAPGDADTSVATTAFVQTAITSAINTAISGSNPAFCAAVTACVGSLPSGASLPGGAFQWSTNGSGTVTFLGIVAQSGLSFTVSIGSCGSDPAYTVSATFTTPMTNPFYGLYIGRDDTIIDAPDSFSRGLGGFSYTECVTTSVAGTFITNFHALPIA